MFEKSLKENNKRKILLVHPSPKEVKKLFLPDIRNQIFEVKNYFGRINYQDVNREIIQKLIDIRV